MASASFKNGSLVESSTSTPTSGATLTLVSSSDAYQVLTGTANHTVKFPDATTLLANQKFEIINASTGSISVQDNGSNVIGTVGPGSSMVFRVTDISSANGAYDVTTAPSGAVGLSSIESGEFLALAMMGQSDKSRKIKFDPETVGGNYWKTKLSGSASGDTCAQMSLNGYLYTVGTMGSPVSGTNSTAAVQRFNDDTGAWAAKGNYPLTVFLNCASVAEGFGFSFGGYNNAQSVIREGYKYNDATDAWSIIATAILALAYQSCGYDGKNVYLLGGSPIAGAVGANDRNYAYDPIANVYSSTGLLTSGSGRYVPGGFVMNSLFYLIGGRDNGNAYQANTDIINFTTKTLATGPVISGTRLGMGSGVAIGHGYVIGGTNGGAASITTVERLNPDALSWMIMTPMTTARRMINGGGSLNGRMYGIAGITESANTIQNIVEQYTPFSFFDFGFIKRTTAAPTAVAVAALLNSIAANVPVQVRSDGDNWKTFMSGGSALKLGETVAAKFKLTVMPYWVGGTPDNATAQTTMQFYNDVSNVWTTRQAMGSTRFGHGSFTINGYAYAFEGQGTGGANRHTTEKYNDLTNVWTGATPITATWTPLGIHGFEVDGFGYGVGGSTNTANYQAPVSTNYQYNDTLDTWALKAAVTPAPRAGGFSANQNGKGFIAGGHPTGGANSNTNYRYTAATDTWDTLAVLTSARSEGCGGSSLNGYGYAIGASGGPANAEKYNDQSNSWSNTAALSANHGAASQSSPSFNGSIYAVGNGFASATSEKYNDGLNAWASIASPSTNLAYGSAAAASGYYRNYEMRVAIPAFYPGVGDGIWTTVANVPANQYLGGGFNVGGYGYLVNGFAGAGSQTAQVLRYNNTLDNWMYAQSNSTAMYSVLAFALEGRGHRVSGQTNSTHEVLNAVTNAWTSATSGPGSADYAQGSSLNGRGYAMGASGPSTYQYYLNTTNAWTSITGNGNGVANHRWAQGGLIFGFMADGQTTSVSKYNDVTDAWSAAASSIVARNGRQALVYKGQGLMASSATSYVTSSEIYNDSINSWVSSALLTGVGYPAPFSLQNSSYLASGYNGSPVVFTQKFTSGIKSAVLSAGLNVS